MSDNPFSNSVNALINFLDKGSFGLSPGTIGARKTFDWVHQEPDTTSNNGPKFKADTVQTSTYGMPIPRIYGRVCTAGNLFWMENNKLRVVSRNVQPESGGGGS